MINIIASFVDFMADLFFNVSRVGSYGRRNLLQSLSQYVYTPLEMTELCFSSDSYIFLCFGKLRIYFPS